MIPKIIHYCWFGGNPIPDEFQRCIDSWKRVMPDYEIKRWDESNYDVKKCAYMNEAYEAEKWGFVPDYARLDICCTYGGIYLDVDVEVIKPFDDLLVLDGFCGIETGRSKTCYVNLGLALGLVQGHEMGGIMRDDYHSLSFKKKNGTPDLTPSPVIQTRSLLQHGFKPENSKQIIKGLTVFPVEYFCPADQFTGETNITENTYSIHHYAASWCSPADRERRDLRKSYSRRYGRAGSEILSTLVSYKKHYGLFGMWKQIAGKAKKKLTGD